LASRFGLLPRGVEGQYFKPVHDGWLFGAPRPWLSYGRRPTYLVTDEQKAMLAARIRTSRYIRLLLGIPLVVTAPFWVNLVPSFSQVGNTVLVFGLYLNTVHFIEYLMIRSQLTDLPRTAERMFMISMVRQQSEAMSVRSQAGLCVFFGLMTALMVGGLRIVEPAIQDFLRYVALASGLFFTLWLGMLLSAIWRSRHPGAVPPDPNSGRSS
jgi:hypothetical protein